MAESMMCCPLSSSDDGDRPECFRKSIRTARKDHQCYECSEPIARGQRYEHVSGIWDRRPETYKTCLSCVEIRDHFACNGFFYGQVWEDLENNFFPDMKAGGPCMEGLSPAAKARLFEARTEWLFESDWCRDGAPPPEVTRG